MADWSLEVILSSLHEDIQRRLSAAREAFAHPVSKGDASEKIWLGLLQTYLPKRYQVTKAFVVDSQGKFSEQIDVVVFDRQYSPFILNYEGEIIIPAESVYAVFEVKQTANAELVRYAQRKVASVRNLRRTSLPIPYADGTYPAKALIPIFGGILTLESEWKPALGETFQNLLASGKDEERLDVGCVASHGYFYRNDEGNYDMVPEGKPATAFLFKLISRLQLSGTVPMIDVDAYGSWLTK